MTLLGKKAHKVEGVSMVEWSGAQQHMAYWIPEMDPKPARMAIMAIPARDDITVKNLYNASHVPSPTSPH